MLTLSCCRAAGIAVAGALVAAPLAVASTATAAPARTASAAVESSAVATVQVSARKVERRKKVVRFRKAVKRLDRRAEKRRGYARSKFRHWIDANGDCEDTRAEVLKQESKRRVTKNRYCTIKRGKWTSKYDGRRFKRASKLDVDHLVPLAEAWDSGARRWTSNTRKRYSNDLGDRRALIAVSAHSNRSKSDRDPAQWMPRKHKCWYAKSYTAVKLRWRLTVNGAEKRKLKQMSHRCSNSKIRYTKATVHKTRKKRGGTHKPKNNTDKRYDTCTEAKQHNTHTPYYKGKDKEYNWYRDSDNDGVVCE